MFFISLKESIYVAEMTIAVYYVLESGLFSYFIVALKYKSMKIINFWLRL